MTADVDICNVALDILSQAPIMSLTDSTASAKRCNRNYALCRDYVLRAHDWNFARKRATLAEIATGPDFEYEHQFRLPSDIIALRYLWNTESEYELEGTAILINDSTCSIKYTSRFEDPNYFTADFIQALAQFLAYRISYSTKQNATYTESIFKQYESMISMAKGVDAQESPERKKQQSGWIKARCQFPYDKHRGIDDNTIV